MHHALTTLLKAHGRARLRRLTLAFSTPRRTLLSLLIVFLAVVWTGQTVASMLMREPSPPEVFRNWLAAVLAGWTVWHVLRVAWKRPETAIEWSAAEEAQIVAGPFSAREQLVYRFLVILTATLPKALLTILILWPDLSWVSPIGLVAALVGLELFRMLMDVATCCLSRRGYQSYRLAVFGAAIAAAVFFPLEATVRNPDAAAGSTAQLQMNPATVIVSSLLSNPAVKPIAFPFLRAAEFIAGQGSRAALAVTFFAMIATLATMAMTIIALESAWRRQQIRSERELWRLSAGSSNSARPMAAADGRLPRVPWCGPVMWRQWRRVLQYKGSLLISMAIPALLMSPAALSIPDASTAFGFVLASTLFYTFVLLPEAIKFDFRLDSDHMVQLKLLPMTAARITIGQLATPVVLGSLFQVVVLSAVGFYRSVDPLLVVVGLALCLPLTVLFVALDNLVFLLYPHRPTQEGFEAFLRTILKFTGKMLLITLFLLSLVAWAPAAAAIASALPFHASVASVFVPGVIAGIVALALAATACVTSAFRRFDPSLHGLA
ncbi:MAG: hypothetical protein R3C19_02220 [Planctomycetaceae bacterium]